MAHYVVDDCPCCGGGDPPPPECEYCDPDEPQASYYVHGLAGVTDGTCEDCDDYNTDPIELVYVSECRWEASDEFGGCTGGRPTLVINSDGSATLTIGGATYAVETFDCEGGNEFTLDSPGDDCDDWPEEVTIDLGEVGGCPNCPDGSPAAFTITISGVTDVDDCQECAAQWNGDHTLELASASGCFWQKLFTAFCGAGAVNRIDLEPPSGPGGIFNPNEWQITILENYGGNGAVRYHADEEGFNCLGATVFTKAEDISNPICDGFPDTLTLTPA